MGTHCGPKTEGTALSIMTESTEPDAQPTDLGPRDELGQQTPTETPFPTPDEAQTEDRQPMSPLSMALAAVAVVAVAIALVLAFSGSDDGDAAIGSNGELDDLAFLTTDGTTSTLAEYRGDALVVNFFASWCAPCRAEMPDLEQVHLARQDEVRFVGINHDLDEATWRSFVDETEVTFETVFQPDTEIFTALDAKGMPTTALVSADGEVVYLHTGLLTDELLEELIDEHFGGA